MENLSSLKSKKCYDAAILSSGRQNDISSLEFFSPLTQVSLKTAMKVVTHDFISLNRTGARDSENASLTLRDLASLFTQDEERDDEQSVTGSFGFYEPIGALSPD